MILEASLIFRIFLNFHIFDTDPLGGMGGGAQKIFIVYLHVLKGSELNESIKKNLYFFGRKLWSGLEPPPPPQRPTPPKNTSFFFWRRPLLKILSSSSKIHKIQKWEFKKETRKLDKKYARNHAIDQEKRKDSRKKKLKWSRKNSKIQEKKERKRTLDKE